MKLLSQNIQKYLVLGTFAVTIVAALKTILVVVYLLDDTRGMSQLTLLIFIAFWLLTAIIATGICLFAQRIIESKRTSDLLTIIDEQPGKENLVAAHAKSWGFTKSEADITVMVVKGFSNGEIAKMRGTAVQTVKTQLSAIYQKSGLGGRYQLIAFITDEVCEMSRKAETR